MLHCVHFLVCEFDEPTLCKSTDGFNKMNFLGKGGFGAVYKGNLNGTMVAVKKMDVSVATVRFGIDFPFFLIE